MTSPGKWYWIRKKGSSGPGLPNGILAGLNSRGKSVWTQKPAIARVFGGGPAMDSYLAKKPDQEAVEVVLCGTKRYHGRIVEDWKPA